MKFENNHLEISGINPNQEKQELDYDYLTISACAEPVEEKCIESVVSVDVFNETTNRKLG